MSDRIALIHTIPLARFILDLGNGPHMASQEFCEGPGKRISESAFDRVRQVAPDLHAARVTSNVEGFTIAHRGQSWSGGVICVWDESTSRVVGGQAQGVPYVLEEFRGRKLGREIQLKAFETGIKTIHDLAFFSPGGLGARKSAHRFAVERALENGIEVSDEVLADYPHLTQSLALAG